MLILQVALPVPIFTNFDYKVSKNILAQLPQKTQKNLQSLIGCRVKVPFGNRILTAIVVAFPKQSTFSDKLKSVIEFIDTDAIFSGNLLSLATWLSNYYIYPIGDTFGVMLPTQLKQGKPLQLIEKHWKITDESLSYSFSKQAKKQHAQYEIIAQYSKAGCLEHTLLQQGLSRPIAKALVEKNLIESFYCAPVKQKTALAAEPLALNNEQRNVFNTVNTALEQEKYTGFLLNGITGSGKTEIYLQMIHEVLKKGKQALVLVPEIGLTPQTVQRFEKRFKANIITMHSRMNDTERLNSWTALHSGYADIIIGTRSAVLCSFKNLGLIIVDEEHDSSYKQQTTLRYHARDVALYRGVQEQCPVLLGSATPSLDSIHRVHQEKLVQVNLTKRAGQAQTASMQVIDTRGKYLQSSLCDDSLKAIAHTLQKGEQVLIFLNRRGYAPALTCEACGWIAECQNCDARLTLHQQPYQYLKCHHCEWKCYIPKTCTACNSLNIKPVGTGTARLEELLAEQLPQYPLFRIDADTTRKKNSWEVLYNTIHKNEPVILLGTQMLAKGHHFPNVTLVVMPTIDNAMMSSDFRAPEKVAQLMLQVSGRAGRGEKKGTVLIQSRQPENPQLQTLIHKGYNKFAANTLLERKQLMLPPYRFCALVRVASKNSKKNDDFIHTIKQKLLAKHQQNNQQILTAWGPLPAPMHRQAQRFHTHLFILSNNRSALHTLLKEWWHLVLQMPEKRYISTTLDIDPIEF